MSHTLLSRCFTLVTILVACRVVPQSPLWWSLTLYRSLLCEHWVQEQAFLKQQPGLLAVRSVWGLGAQSERIMLGQGFSGAEAKVKAKHQS